MRGRWDRPDVRRRLADARGMTLVELMTVLTVFSIVMGAVASLLVTSLAVYSKGGVNAQAQVGSQIGIDRIERDLRQARRLVTGIAETVGAASFTFNTACSPTQLSFALPHLTTVTLSDSTTIYATDTSGGQTPYDGWYVSYYLSAAEKAPAGSLAPTSNAAGPYLIRAQYDLVALKFTYGTVEGTSAAFTISATGGCPTVASTDVTVSLKGSATAVNESVTTTEQVNSDVMLRNQQ